VKVKFDKDVCTVPTVTLPNKSAIGPEKGKKYKLDQFHVHALSEHTIDGKTYSAELHMVHLEDFPNGARPVSRYAMLMYAPPCWSKERRF
jgi:carbonic anhydrase